MNNIQNEIIEWPKKIFPKATKHTLILQLHSEVDYLHDSMLYNGSNAIKESLTDCMIVLFNIAESYGFDALEEVKKKIE